MVCQLRVVLLGLAATSALLSQVNAREIIRNAVVAGDRNWKISRNYSFQQRVELRRLDAHGREKSSEVQTYDVTLRMAHRTGNWSREETTRRRPPNSRGNKRA